MARHVYDCHVRFSDVDVYGHVNNVKYFEYYQEARLAFLTTLGRSLRSADLGLVVARLDVDYKVPILFRAAPYTVTSWVSRVGTSSFGVGAEILDGDRLLSRAHAVLVAFDLATQRSRPLGDDERARLVNALEE